jgi:hypothetical protein
MVLGIKARSQLQKRCRHFANPWLAWNKSHFTVEALLKTLQGGNER